MCVFVYTVAQVCILCVCVGVSAVVLSVRVSETGFIEGILERVDVTRARTNTHVHGLSTVFVCVHACVSHILMVRGCARW